MSFFTSAVLLISGLLGLELPALRLNERLLSDRVSSSQRARLKSEKIFGSHIIVWQNHKEVLNALYGFSDRMKTPLSGNEIYRIASMTKPVTAVAMLAAYEDGLIDIYEEVSHYLPEFGEMYLALRDKNGELVKDEAGNFIKDKKAVNSIKVYQCVSHITGLPEISEKAFENGEENLESAVSYLSEQPLLFEPGTEQLYCTSAYDIVARIIEIKSGLNFNEYLKKRIFDRLGMEDTTFMPDSQQKARFVRMHAVDENKKSYEYPTDDGCNFAGFGNTYFGAGCSLVSSAADYLKFALMLQNGGEGENGVRVVSENSIKLLSTPVPEMKKIMPSSSWQWGLAVRVIVKTGDRLPKGSFGWSGAYGTHFWIDKQNNITALYFKNSVYDGGAGCLTANEFEKDVMKSLSLRRLLK